MLGLSVLRAVLARLPAPFLAWLVLCNDPDVTLIEDWRQLHKLIWEDLELPFADSFFISSINESCPGLVNLGRFPEILDAHPHDTMHTWGDYTGNRTRRFHRQDAVNDLDYMRQLGAAPRVWVDHSNFSGNLMHGASRPQLPLLTTATGHVIENFDYTLDLVEQAGIRYLWDGELTNVIGQDRPLTVFEWAGPSHRAHRLTKAALAKVGRSAWRRYGVSELVFDRRSANRQYQLYVFPDGRRFYAFKRYGDWALATIDGLAQVIDNAFLDRLVQTNGTSVIYTHLGLRAPGRSSDRNHVPLATRKALAELAGYYRRGLIKLSSTSHLLDYLVLRDNAEISGDTINFHADGIAFPVLEPEHLSGFTFSVKNAGRNLTIQCEGKPVEASITEIARNTYTFQVHRSRTHAVAKA